jgi:acyl carrier protein
VSTFNFFPHHITFMPELTTQALSLPADAALLLEVAELVVSALNLEVSAADVQADEPLYGDGLGLDSIDILEIALVVSKRYGLQLRADSDDNHAIFQSLRSLSDHIAAHRSK